MAYYQSTAKKTGVAFGMMQSAAGAVISNGKWNFFSFLPGTSYGPGEFFPSCLKIIRLKYGKSYELKLLKYPIRTNEILVSTAVVIITDNAK